MNTVILTILVFNALVSVYNGWRIWHLDLSILSLRFKGLYIMTTVADLKAQVAALAESSTAVSTKFDAVVALVTDLKSQVAALQAAGNGASQADLDALGTSLQGISDTLTSVASKEDAAVAA